MPEILKKLLTRFLTTICLAFVVQNASAQNVEIGASIGVANYFGDLAPTPVVSETKGASGVFARINFSSSFAWTNSFSYAQVSGNDKNFAFNSARNLNFKSDIYEYASTFEFNYLKYGVGVLENKFTSYLFAGIGVFGFNAQGYYNNQWYNLKDFQTEGVSYQPYSFAIPFGIGVKWILNKNFNFECQLGFRRTYTDYLDDVSKTYPDITLKLKSSAAAATLTDPSALLNGGVFVNKNGYKRGNSDNYDWYMIAQVSLSYRIYRKVKCARFY